MRSVPGKASVAEFKAAYRKALGEVYRFWTPAMQAEIARHCCGWSVGCFDFHAYLRASEPRYLLCWSAFVSRQAVRSVCDVGGFWGVYPLTLRELGLEVTMTESLRFYSASFDPLFSFIRERGVVILDYDPFEAPPQITGRFDAVTAMAVLEHYPHSLRPFMSNVLAMLKAGGAIYIEVPNIAYWPKRTALLRGRTPLVPVTDIYRSAVPFIGHHHEFTREELHALVEVAGLRVEAERCYSYSQRQGLVLRFVRRPVQALAELLLPDARECLAVLASKAPVVEGEGP